MEYKLNDKQVNPRICAGPVLVFIKSRPHCLLHFLYPLVIFGVFKVDTAKVRRGWWGGGGCDDEVSDEDLNERARIHGGDGGGRWREGVMESSDEEWGSISALLCVCKMITEMDNLERGGFFSFYFSTLCFSIFLFLPIDIKVVRKTDLVIELIVMSNKPRGFRPLKDLTERLATRADDSHATPVNCV